MRGRREREKANREGETNKEREERTKISVPPRSLVFLLRPNFEVHLMYKLCGLQTFLKEQVGFNTQVIGRM